MSAGLLLDVARESAGSVRRALDRHPASGVPAGEVERAARFTRGHTEAIRLLWGELLSGLEEGMESREAGEAAAQLATLAGHWLPVLGIFQDYAAEAARASGRPLKAVAD